MTKYPEFGAEALRQDGFTIARAVLSAEEVDQVRDLVRVAKSRAVGAGLIDVDPNYPALTMLRGDALAIPELAAVDYLVLDRRIVALVKQLLGDEVIYHGDSTVQVGEGPRGFHKDNADRGDASGIDWQGEYGVLRFGVYLQDHTAHSGGLKVRVASHRKVSHHAGKATNLPTAAGDVVFWLLTTSHSGNFIRCRVAPNICLHPRIESLIPRNMRMPEQSERMAIFCTYGRPGAHINHYIEYQTGRADVIKQRKYCGNHAGLDDLAKERSVTLRRPGEDYGGSVIQKSR
jgi:Phytanoyl-CoA dioxygenase (PhyH)